MSDLVRRARRLDTCIFPTERSKCLCGELADRIKKLEAALRKIIDRAEFKNSEYVTDIVCRIAREALEGEDD